MWNPIRNSIKKQTKFLSTSIRVRIEERPRPWTLPKEDQLEFERLVKEREENQEKNPDYVAPHYEFEGEKNPVTGEIGGPKGKEPTRYGDWERNGRVYDF
jgi:hypothetical protein